MECRLERGTIHYEEAGKGEKPPSERGGFSREPRRRRPAT
jgi:hypothetical protein